MVLHGRLCVVREPFKRGNLPGEQIRWVSLCDLLARAFLGSYDEVLLMSVWMPQVSVIGVCGAMEQKVRLDNSRCCSADALSFIYRISPAEARVAAKLAEGYNLAEIAELISLSIDTVRTHVKRLLVKLDCASQAALIREILLGPALSLAASTTSRINTNGYRQPHRASNTG